jgi:hypothetical protein
VQILAGIFGKLLWQKQVWNDQVNFFHSCKTIL